MHRLDRIRTREHQVFVATLEGQAAEVISSQIHLLQRRSRCAVKHQHWPRRAVKAFKKTDALCGEHQPINRPGECA